MPAIVGGHLWTVLPQVRHQLFPKDPPTPEPWSGHTTDKTRGQVKLAGLHHRVPGSTTLLLIVHGLGGTPQSPYCLRATTLAAQHGWSSLRIGMRGSTGDGEDIYHAGVGADLGHVLRAPDLKGYERVFILGYSLGGHITLTHALDPAERVVAVAAVSAPLDLELSAQAIDRYRGWVYRHHMLRSLKDCYRAVAEKRSVPTKPANVDRVDTIRQWDTLTVVPRFGFRSAEDYYRRMSVGAKLSKLKRPTLYTGMRHDPMIPAWAVAPSLEAASTPHLEVRWLDRGGHVAAPGSWETDVFDWFERR